MRGQLNFKKESDMAEPIIYAGRTIRTARNRSSVMLNSRKMNLNFNQSSPIMEHTARYTMHPGYTLLCEAGISPDWQQGLK